MKKIFLLIVAFAAQMNFAQNVFPLPSGNVGIGTTVPDEKLVISGNSARLKIQTASNPAVYNTYLESNYSAGNTFNIVDGGIFKFGAKEIGAGTSDSYVNSYYGIGFATNSTNADASKVRMYINQLGSVGIGTINPAQKLDVNGNGIFNGGIISTVSGAIGGYIKIKNPAKTSSGSASDWTIFNMSEGYGNSLQFWAYDNLGCTGGMCSNRFTIMDNGNVGIGSINPVNKLDVNGVIHSKEVKVDMLGWSDFVFKKKYDLPRLEEVEKHIKEKGHLENIPSEEEVVNNGINLGEMNAKLLQKIEELTLYVIEQNKIIKEQNNRLDKLEKKN